MSALSREALSRPAAARSPVPSASVSLSRSASPISGPDAPLRSLPLSELSLGPSADVPCPWWMRRSGPAGRLSGVRVLLDMCALLEWVRMKVRCEGGGQVLGRRLPTPGESHQDEEEERDGEQPQRECHAPHGSAEIGHLAPYFLYIFALCPIPRPACSRSSSTCSPRSR